MGYNLSRIWSWLRNQMVGYYKWKKGDNMNILKLQRCFIWLLFFNNLRKRTSHNVFENFWMKTEAHLISSQSYHTRLFIPRTRIRDLSCGNRRHSSTFAIVNSAIFWHCGLRWFTVNHSCERGPRRHIYEFQNIAMSSILNFPCFFVKLFRFWEKIQTICTTTYWG
jgi:hypothetical protein